MSQWFVVYTYNGRKCYILLEVSENKDINVFPSTLTLSRVFGLPVKKPWSGVSPVILFLLPAL
jgi:hypothetical protein